MNNLASFDNARMTSVEALDDALFVLKSSLSQNNFGRVLESLLEDKSQALPLIISNIDGQDVPLQKWILDSFPVQPNPFTRSLHQKLLMHLSDYFLFTPPITFDREIELDMSFKHKLIRKIPALLDHVSKLNFNDKPPSDEDELEIVPLSQKQRKKRQRTSAKKHVTPDEKLFKDAELDIPNCQADVDGMVESLLGEQKSILEDYFIHLRSKNVPEVIKQRSIVAPVNVLDDSPIVIHHGTVPASGSLDEAPSAYPKIQPMKSALYFDSVAGFGDWTIFINQNAHNELRIKHKKDKDTFDIIVKKIRELSQGHFSPDNQKRLKGIGTEVPIFEAKMTGDLRLIYQVDVVAGGDEHEQQAIKIFGIYTHAQMDDRLWTSIGSHLGRRGKIYKERCSARVPAPNADDQTFIPASFPPLPEVQEDTDSPNLLADDSNPVHSRFLMEKYVVFSQPLMNTILADVEATFPHLVSSQEKLIIEHPYSCYVIGRSGTGKTTTLLFKMLLIERTAQLAGGDAPKPRQIFVTQSRVLAKKVEQYFVTLVKSLAATNQTLEELRNLKASQQPLSLDEDDEDMIHIDDIIDWTGDLPSKFSELRDEHFPLFTTFENLCSMLEADVVEDKPAKKTHSAKSSISTTPSNLTLAKATVLTYEDFLRDYWPHFPQSAAKRLDPALVFSEFLGVIKGSEETLSGDLHHLTRTEYLNLSSRGQSTFADNRENIYTLFKAYLDLKKRHGHIDGADRTHAILDSFSLHGTPGQKVDHLYVDEVQDNLLVDTLVLRALCHDPNGLFWAGDTAQTISVGSSFRFNALKAFQWRLEEKRSKDLDSDEQRAVQPEIFQLAVNYRSHAGIVNCAHSVVDLISRFWKDSIDKLSPEKGVVDGLKPVFFAGWDEDSAGLEHFIFGDSGNRIEFGAQQCILVRDNDAREKLRALVGEGIGLIMTIYESKGLEFNDVLLYNFFSDSPAESSQWRVILRALEEEGIAIPDFEGNRARYTSICSELKFLYVAITRARENIWIVDSSNKSEPMRRYWTKNDLIRNLTPGMNAPKLATSSTPEEWAKQGRNLFQRKKYVEAKHCFERALLPERVAIADAYILRAKAQAIRTDTKVNRQSRKQMFSSAALAFEKCARSASRKIRLDFLRLAGDCYKNAEELLLAAQAYREARLFTESVLCYRDVNHFDEAIDIVKKEASSVEQSVIENVVRLAKLFYFNEVQVLPSSSAERDTKLNQACGLFEGVDNVLDYLSDRDLDIARAAVLVAHGQYEEAAQLCLEEGRTLEAIELLLKVPSHEKAAQKARDYILKGLWDHLSFGVLPGDTHSPVSRLLDLALKAGTDSAAFNAEVTMFRAILAKSTTELRLQAKIFLETKNIAAAVLCFDHIFDTVPRLTDLSVSSINQELDVFLSYIQLLSSIITEKNLQDSGTLQKLFGFQRLSESHVLLTTGTYLHAQCIEAAANPDQDFMLPSRDLSTLIHNQIGARLRNRISKENNECKNAKAVYICHNFSIYGSCTRPACPHAHVRQTDLNKSYYNGRVRIHLQQILILHALRASEYASEFMSDQRKFWLIRLYEVLFPSSHLMGCYSELDVGQILESDRAFRIIREWIRNGIYTLSFRPSVPFMSHLLRLTSLALLFDREASQHYLHQGSYARESHPRSLRRPGNGLVAHEMVSVFQGFSRQCLVAGIFSLKHIAMAQVPIDVGVLCDTLDHFCRSLVVSICARRDQFIHNVTLPRSWLLEPIDINLARSRDVGFLNLLMEPLATILDDIYTRQDYLLYESRKLADAPPRVRSVYLARICRMLCLIGYNLNNADVRHRILKCVTSLRAEGRIHYPPYSWYIQAENWDALSVTVRRSIIGNDMDEMVQLLHRSRIPAQIKPITGVRQIFYDNLIDIPRILRDSVARAQHTLIPGRSRLNPSAASFVPKSASKPVPEERKEEVEEEEQVEDVEEQELPAAALPLSEEPEIPEPTELEHRMASFIQVRYRSRMSARNEKKSRYVQIRDNFWLQCLKQGDIIGRSYYTKMMFGPLPHLWAVLEYMNVQTLEMKSNTKKRMSLKLVLKPEELERLDNQLTRISSALKKIKKFQTSLSVQSDVHQKRDSPQLKQLVRDLEKFIQEDLPFQLPLDMQIDYDIGYKGIVKEPEAKVVKKPTKPELNTSDCYE